MKTLLFIPLDYHKPNVHLQWFEAFKTKFNTTYFDGSSGDYDYIFMQSGALSPERLREIKGNAIVYQWTGDCRPELLSEVMLYKGIADRTFLACGLGQKQMYEDALGHSVEWMQHAATIFIEPKEMQSGQITFIGNYYDQFPGGDERNKLCIDLLSKYGHRFDSFGSWGAGRGSVIYNATPGIYSNSYISISANIFNDIDGYWSNRSYDILASGSCCLMRYVPGIEKHFTHMEHCVYYNTNDEALGLIEWLIHNPEYRNAIAKAGYLHVKENHTFLNRVNQLC